jgi:hypothetical protein
VAVSALRCPTTIESTIFGNILISPFGTEPTILVSRINSSMPTVLHTTLISRIGAKPTVFGAILVG